MRHSRIWGEFTQETRSPYPAAEVSSRSLGRGICAEFTVQERYYDQACGHEGV